MPVPKPRFRNRDSYIAQITDFRSPKIRRPEDIKPIMCNMTISNSDIAPKPTLARKVTTNTLKL